MAGGTVEIITGRERRRRWQIEEKLRIVAETYEPGARVTEVAARHGVYPSLLFHWRRQAREGALCRGAAASFTPVRIASGLCEPFTEPGGEERCSPGVLEITLRNGIRFRIDQRIDVHALRRIVGVLGG